MTVVPDGSRAGGVGMSPALRALSYSVALAVACLLSYLVTTGLLSRFPFVGPHNALLGGMWSVVATVFVYRLGWPESISAARSRSASTAMSFALCLVWLLVLPPGPVALAVLIGVGAGILLLARRAEDVVTTGVTTAVVIVSASSGPVGDAWQLPLLRALDTAIGVIVGLVAAALAHRLSNR